MGKANGNLELETFEASVSPSVLRLEKKRVAELLHVATDVFLANGYVSAVLGLQSLPLTRAKQKAHIDGALNVFLRAYGAPVG